jgi:hypothetical protein
MQGKSLSKWFPPGVAVLILVAVGLSGIILQRDTVFASQQSEPSFAKNLQVLKFVKSKAELKGWMQMIKTSLGVDCDYCHNTDNFASDEKPTKRKARMMLRMLVQIRQDYFSYPDAKLPTCYTCHQGNKEPVNEPPGGFKSGD